MTTTKPPTLHPRAASTTTTSSPPPLTTTFTPSAWCLTDLYLESVPEPSGYGCAHGSCSYTHLGPATSTSACFPSGWAPTHYFSPGLCPSGYTDCGVSIATLTSSTTEYRATCCPSGYSCQLSSDSPWPWYTSELCSVVSASTIDYTITTNTSASPYLSTATRGVNNFDAYGISIRWKPADFEATSTSSLSIATTVAASTTTAATSTSSSGAHAKSSLSTGAKAGIGVGVAIAGILIIAAAVFGMRYVRRRQKQNVAHQVPANLDSRPRFEMEETTAPPPVQELDATVLSELEGSGHMSKPVALNGGHEI